MSCYIFGSAPIKDYDFIKLSISREDVVICADGGLNHAKKLLIAPDFLVGDFDSIENENAIESEDNISCEIIRLVPEKDDTDMKVSLDKGIELGQKDFYIYGGLGGRFDHSMANIQTMFSLLDDGVRVTLIDEQNKVFAIKDETVSIPKSEYKYLSVLALSQTAIVSEYGVKYAIENYTMDYKTPLGVSNEIIEDEAKITVKSGAVMIILSK